MFRWVTEQAKWDGRTAPISSDISFFFSFLNGKVKVSKNGNEKNAIGEDVKIVADSHSMAGREGCHC